MIFKQEAKLLLG